LLVHVGLLAVAGIEPAETVGSNTYELLNTVYELNIS